MAGQVAQVYGHYINQKDGTLLPVKQATFSVNNTTATVVAAVTGKKIAIVGIDLTLSAAGTVAWLSNASSIRDAQNFAANGGIQATYGPGMVFAKTVAGDPLKIVVSGATANGMVNYVEEP